VFVKLLGADVIGEARAKKPGGGGRKQRKRAAARAAVPQAGLTSVGGGV
jgi:multiple sugar transport system permease protein